MMEEDKTPVRFGILGCANIARKVSRAIGLAPNAVVTAVGSRSSEKAARFIAANSLPGSPRAHGSYEAVLDDPCVDAVYVPLPTSLHVRWAVAAAERGKHVLLEKPVALSTPDLDRILEACEANGVQFMDGTMWLHHPRTARMKLILSDAELFGPPKIIHSTCTFPGTPEFLEHNIRMKPDLDALGALGDLGWYPIGAILWAVDYQLPTTTTALPTVQLNEAGVVLACSASFQWADGKAAIFHCSFLTNVSNQLSVHSASGSLQVKDVFIPYSEDSASYEFNSRAAFTELHIGWSKKPEEVLVMTDLPQEALMIEHFAELVQGIRDSKCRPDSKWPAISRKTQLLVDAVKKSIELGFKPVNL